MSLLAELSKWGEAEGQVPTHLCECVTEGPWLQPQLPVMNC